MHVNKLIFLLLICPLIQEVSAKNLENKGKILSPPVQHLMTTKTKNQKPKNKNLKMKFVMTHSGCCFCEVLDAFAGKLSGRELEKTKASTFADLTGVEVRVVSRL